jgi:SAM-dependent methyltransferase
VERGRFFDTGRHDIQAALQRITALGIGLNFEMALDFGCGLGRLTQALAGHFREVHGVDISPSMIAKAHELNNYGDRCVYHPNDRPDLRPFDADTFDLVYSWLVLQRMPKQLALGFISEFARVTKPGGVMVFQIPDRWQHARPGANVGRVDLPLEFSLGQEPSMLMCETSYDEVVTVLEKAGVRVLEAEEDCGADPTLVICYYGARRA